MIMLLISIGLLIFSINIYRKKDTPVFGLPSKYSVYIGHLVLVLSLLGVASRSFFYVNSDETAHLKRIYFGADLPIGQIIALDGQKGPKANIYGTGFHFIPLVRILHDVEFSRVIDIPEGQYGFVSSLDGMPLRDGQFISDELIVPESKDGEPVSRFYGFYDAEFFLKNGGQRGPQLTVLTPGRHRLNSYLFKVDLKPATDVPTGHVAVIRSNVQEDNSIDCPNSGVNEGQAGGAIAAPIVPVGCIGVWSEPLPPKRYYLNLAAFVPTVIPTRLVNWNYKGGYTARRIDLKVSDDGQIIQTENSEPMPIPADAADKAINVRVEGWTIPVEARIIVQVHPKNAPRVVASIGDLKRIEDTVITPTVRDVLRTIGGAPERKVLDFIEKRDEISELVEAALIKEAEKTGVTVQEVRLGEPAIPPELLVASLREQLAKQLEKTYIQEKEAQQARIAVQKEKATADQQPTLVKAQIEKEAAKERKETLRLEGEGEKLKLIEIAKGQKEQVSVLGQDRVMRLQMLEKTLNAAVANPDIVKVSTVNVQSGQGSTLEGAAAVLGSSNLVQMLNQQKHLEQSTKNK